MRRDLYQKLLSWRDSPERKPLLVKGARQVGKTFLLQEFGREQYPATSYFNFEEDPRLDSLFVDSLDPQKIIEKLSIYQNRKITPEELIIFDEIQESPNALKCLKYFQEKFPSCPIACAGSLLGLHLKKGASFPVGKVDFLTLAPMSFGEFLAASAREQYRELLETKRDLTPLDALHHQELIETLKTYYFVGGMPEVVKTYLQERDLTKVRKIQKDILQSFVLDFSKHATPFETLKINQIWNSLPAQLAKENKKFQLSKVKKSARARDYLSALQWLLDASLVTQAVKVSQPAVPLAAYEEPAFFKLYGLDVGLLGAMSGLTAPTILQGNDLFTHFKGALIENYAAQELMAHLESPLHFWSSPGTAEVDFLLTLNETIIPLEIKAGRSRRSKSLAEFMKKYHPLMGVRASLRNFGREGCIVQIPLYALSLLRLIPGPIDRLPTKEQIYDEIAERHQFK